MIPEREHEALMRLTMCAREECGMCKYKERCNYDFQYEIATESMNILAIALNADRKTEQTEPKRGEWIPIGIKRSVFECSECGTIKRLKSNFCPRCGADMRGEGDEDD